MICGGEDFAIACMRSNLRYGKNQKREDVKSHHYIISFDPRDAADNGLSVDRAQQLGDREQTPPPPTAQRMVQLAGQDAVRHSDKERVFRAYHNRENLQGIL